MVYRVVCMSSHDGAGVGVVAASVAERLGYRLLDADIIARAAAEAGLDGDVVADVERRKSLLGRLREALGSGGSTDPLEDALYGGTGPDELRALIRWAIEEEADEGSAVIVAHAASFALASREDVLRVLVTASRSVRQRRLAERSDVDENEASSAMRKSDAGRTEYIRHFYGVGEELPTHYDLVINTDKLAADTATHLVVTAVTREP